MLQLNKKRIDCSYASGAVIFVITYSGYNPVLAFYDNRHDPARHEFLYSPVLRRGTEPNRSQTDRGLFYDIR